MLRAVISTIVPKGLRRLGNDLIGSKINLIITEQSVSSAVESHETVETAPKIGESKIIGDLPTKRVYESRPPLHSIVVIKNCRI